ncbi:hypothetical protein PSm6_06860 [Pseudomonas solani]|uniref:Uncharacterized protein n=1 Tax=Pseudomonas solani TaxID=2731552 RepID=A0ABM7L432_9PSED|nr:hypothetical protein [Pseudomonas solani]BCD84279.1 hypothetical protein PSm6_06860 [Pseudomonas solani]
MTLDSLRRLVLEPALSLLPDEMNSPEAQLMLLAIALQESDLDKRPLAEGGPHSYWQSGSPDEMVHFVLRCPVTRDLAVAVCDARQVPPVDERVRAALEHDDVLAAAFARLLLWTDPARLPAIDEVDAAHDLYMRTWRTPDPRPELWCEHHARALKSWLSAP